MNNILRLRSLTKYYNFRRYSAKHVLDAENRQLYDDIFPIIYK